MSKKVVIIKETSIDLQLADVNARVVYHKYDGIWHNLTLVSFNEQRLVLSTLDGLRKVRNVGNIFFPDELSKRHMTLQSYEKVKKQLPKSLGLSCKDFIFLSTAVNMECVSVCEKTFGDFHVCCIATGGALDNALRAGVDAGNWVETQTQMKLVPGTINIMLLTNVTLTLAAMARAIMTATEAKSAALQDLGYKSSYTPQVQATGTGTDSMLVVSGVNPDIVIKHTGGHTKMGELIGFTAKTAVTEALKKFDKI
ncbi:MAG: adenosylcobinamide amidohydrolase [Nitrososphaerota archaeon]|uniref:adenosylcobinamide amidohydrolase n=1 Tax=Candidatus Bathycorpusculum sp. TaxID=2994959 RepID=UPI0028197737|nr:adenosylcobinamide amidohydrolase [Candidatus Termiticorpusculum sp.]MCL2256657.1 adenosylcobinamide amidohydrolase [Candidatus Termiticorpusculum sp.]MCL2292804.1 adenosylcobinamide amidohydrolase [Candidatus Termiticorpusculum sp.]MDR0460409.1 adenosylcobinamide amidohydrolase [Nitrososphaerota archaeon]